MLRITKILFYLMIVCACVGCDGQKFIPESYTASSCPLVVLADPQDPYYSLAEEIAATEKAPLVPNLPEALACQPVSLLWVVSPDMLSDEVMIDFGMTMKQQSSAISSGVITGSTLEQARSLWQRGNQVSNQILLAVNAPNPSAHLDEGRMQEFSQGQVTNNSLTKEKFLRALQTGDYLTFTGHGGNSFLRLDEDTSIKPEDIPSLNGIIVATVSCQTLRPWNDNSIARKMIDQGAAAYSGFLFSPNEGYVIGEFNELPFRYTWPEFPIGVAIQVQNHGTLQGFAHFPYNFLLGDPRIALQSEPPYQLVDDRQEGNYRLLSYRDVPAGVIPIKIVDGAAYNFVDAKGITSASQGDIIYNSRLQMVNIGQDKYILLVHRGGDLSLKLRISPPWYWVPIDFLLDSFDFTYIFIPQSEGDLISLGFSIIPLVWLGRQTYKKRIDFKKIHLCLMVALAITIIQGIYVAIRLPHITSTSKTVIFNPLSLLATFVLTGSGTLIYFQTHSKIGKLAGILVITFSGWAVTIFEFGILSAFNLFAFAPRFGTSLYNYSLGLLSGVPSIISFILTVVVLRLIAKGIYPDGSKVNQ